MTSARHDGHLGAAYDAKGKDEVAALYDRWAESYDADMAKFGYRHPAIGLALLCRHLPRGASPLLDAGCGTGLVGEWLGIAGYPEVDGLDLSEGMLKAAAKKSVYRALTTPRSDRRCRFPTTPSPGSSRPACSPPVMSGRRASTSSCASSGPAESSC